MSGSLDLGGISGPLVCMNSMVHAKHLPLFGLLVCARERFPPNLASWPGPILWPLSASSTFPGRPV